MPSLSKAESDALEQRLKVTREKVRSLQGAAASADGEPTPTIALCTSGGGPRSFLCTVGLMDALAKRGLIDAFAYHACLSGSSWVVSCWLASALAGTPNIFYNNPPHDPWMPPPMDGASMAAGGPASPTAAGEQSAQEVTLDYNRVLNMIATPFLGKLARQIVSGQPMKFWEEHLRKSLLEPFHLANTANTLKFSQMRHEDIAAGRLPIPLCTCIADGAPPEKYDWISFSTFDVTRYSGASSVAKRWDDIYPYSLPQLMSIWGSAFAFDWEAAPQNLRRLAPARYNDPFLSGLGGKELGITSDPHLGRLRDAGIASNIPIPVLLKRRTGRPVDIIVVMDATGLNPGEAQCCQLWRHRDKLPWLNEAEVHRPFDSDEIVRVFIPPTDEDPVLLYTLAYQTKASFSADYSVPEVKAVLRYMHRVAEGIENALRRVLQRFDTTASASPLLLSPMDQVTNDATADLELASRLGTLYRRYYRHMGMLNVAGGASRLPFTSTYTPVTVSVEAGGGGRRGAGETVKMLDLTWPTPEPGKRNFWLVVGTAGVGKSTLSIQMARDQRAIANREGWPFAAILRVSCHVLATLAHQPPPRCSSWSRRRRSTIPTCPSESTPPAAPRPRPLPTRRRSDKSRRTVRCSPTAAGRSRTVRSLAAAARSPPPMWSSCCSRGAACSPSTASTRPSTTRACCASLAVSSRTASRPATSGRRT
jgi:predicted nucleic acid-binding protein